MTRLRYPKFLRAAALFCLLPFALCTGLFLAVVVCLKLCPEESAALLTREVRKRSGLDCTVGAVDAVFFPAPSLSLADVRVAKEGDTAFQASAAYVEIRPRLTELLSGTFVPDEILLARVEGSVRFLRPLLPATDEATPSLLEPPPLLKNCTLILRGGALRLTAPDVAAVLEEPEGQALVAQQMILGRLRLARASLRVGAGPEIVLRDARVELRDVLSLNGDANIRTRDEGAFLRLETRLGLAGVFSDAELEAQMHREETDVLRLRLLARGEMRVREATLPLRTSFSAAWKKDALTIDALELASAGDSIRMAGKLVCGGEATEQDAVPQRVVPPFMGFRSGVLHGSLEVEKFSLPRWFGFARRLPPGIQHALDELRGRVDFSLDGQGINARNIDCFSAKGGHLQGTGAVKSFAEPSVFLDLRSEALNLAEEFPETSGKFPDPPTYSHAPLIPEANSSEFAVLPGIGYDIRIRAERASIDALKIGGLSFRAGPAAKGSLLRFDTREIFGGQAQAVLALAEGESGFPEYSLKLDAHKWDMEALSGVLLPEETRLGGKLSGSADLRSEGERFDQLSARLNGSFSLQADDVAPALRSADAKTGMNKPRHWSLEGTFAGREEKDRLNYAGRWRTQAQNEESRIDLKLEGTLSMARNGFFPLHFTAAPGVLLVQPSERRSGFLPRGLQAEVAGKISLNGEPLNVMLEEAQARVFDCVLNGHARLAFGKEGIEGRGRVSVQGADLRRSLAEAGITENRLNPALLKKFSAVAALAFDTRELSLTEGKGQIDESGFSGTLNGLWKERPTWNFDFRFDTLPLDIYLNYASQPGGQKEKGALSFKFLREFDVEGVLEADLLRLFGLTFAKARIPVHLKEGILECAPVGAKLYNGPVTARLGIRAEKSLGIYLDAETRGMDLRAYSEERGEGAVMNGTVAARMELRGVAREGMSIPAALGGTFRFEAKEGSVQSRGKDRKTLSSPILFDKVEAGGTVNRGIFHFERLYVSGPDLKIRGGGWVNPMDNSLDMGLNMQKSGLPDMPVRVSGKLGEPRTSLQTGQAVMNVLEHLGHGVAGGVDSVGSGLMDVLGGILSMPLRLIKK